MYSKCVAMEAVVCIVGIRVSCRNSVPVHYTNLVTYEFDTILVIPRMLVALCVWSPLFSLAVHRL